jgi:hypothetical protein
MLADLYYDFDGCSTYPTCMASLCRSMGIECPLMTAYADDKSVFQTEMKEKFARYMATATEGCNTPEEANKKMDNICKEFFNSAMHG